MSFYSNYIFPRLCDFTLNNPIVGGERHQLLSQAAGNILEIGFGTGLNLPHYPEHVRKLTMVDPNLGMHRLAQQRINESGIQIDQRQQRSETLPFADATFDCIVSTFTLCSIPGVNQALQEVFRVLRPNGSFLFLEHGLSPDPNIARWQRRLNGIQQWFGDGCHLVRNMRELITLQPFSSVDLSEVYLDKMPKTHGYVYRGVARK